MNRKEEREYLRQKTNERCGYCGKELKKLFHVDHINPLYRGWSDSYCEDQGVTRGTDTVENKIASCPRCNRWKATMSLDKFRKSIQTQHDKLYRNSAGYRIGVDYGIIRAYNSEVVFYFETLNN